MNQPAETASSRTAPSIGVSNSSVPGVWQSLCWATGRDLKIAMRSLPELAVVVVFYLLVTSLFPLAISPDPKLLIVVAPGIAWIATLLASLLALPHLFGQDHLDGSLEQMVLAPAPLAALITGKVLAHWLSTSAPIILVTPLVALQFGLNAQEMIVLLGALVLGTPVVAWFGTIGAALTLSSRGGASLLALLVLPLVIPVLIFGAGAVEASRSGLGADAHLSLLGAGLILATLAGPFASAAAVRIAFE